MRLLGQFYFFIVFFFFLRKDFAPKAQRRNQAKAQHDAPKAPKAPKAQ